MRTGTDTITTIRPIQPSDREPIRQILHETGVFTQEEVDVAIELIDTTLHNSQQKDYEIYTAVGDGGEIAGYFCVGPTPVTTGTYDLYWIAVKPSWHGHGIGKELLRFAESLILPRGARLLIAHTSSQPRYDSTNAFYLRTNFLEAARIKDYYKIGDDLIIYCKYLITP